MTVNLWRIAKNTAQYQANDMSGGGAKTVGGRWNSKGSAVIYTSPTIALATLETLAHIGDEIAARNRFLIQIEVPDDVWKARETLDVTRLDPSWVSEPPGLATISPGDAWIKGNTAALLEVPSVIIHEEFNVLINPAHTDAVRIKASVIRQFVYDPRL
ncbi:MAG: RES family NAD+ phosphorylase [Pseudomonadota bacterium]